MLNKPLAEVLSLVKALPAGEVHLRVIRPRDPTAVGRALAEQRWVGPGVTYDKYLPSERYCQS